MDRTTAYDDDIYAWAFEQAAALRRLAETRRDLPNELDIENLTDEVEGVGRTELYRAESFLRLLLVHLIKMASAPEAPPINHWRTEARVFHEDFRDALTQAMWRRVQLDRRWQTACSQAADQLEGDGNTILPGLPVECPLALEDLTAEPFDPDAAASHIRDFATQPG